MPRRYYFGPVPTGREAVGRGLGTGLERGFESFQRTRSNRRQEDRQALEDERRRRMEDATAERASSAYDTETALRGRSLGGGRAEDMPVGDPRYERYGGVYGLTPEAERQGEMDRLRPLAEHYTAALGKTIPPEVLQRGLDPFQYADPTGETTSRRRMEMLEREIGARRTDAQADRTFRSGQAEADRTFRSGQAEADRTERATRSQADRTSRWNEMLFEYGEIDAEGKALKDAPEGGLTTEELARSVELMEEELGKRFLGIGKNRTVADIDPEDIEEWLKEQGASPEEAMQVMMHVYSLRQRASR